MQAHILAIAEELSSSILRVRRHIHQYPELSFEESKTSVFLAQELEQIGLCVETGFATYGLRSIITGNKTMTSESKYPKIAIRADMDALAIQEETELAFKSCNAGIMHACGHDAHCAMAYGAAAILQKIKPSFSGQIMIFFQPAEEKAPGGSRAMIADGLFKNFLPDAIFGQHINPGLQSANFGFRPGIMMASVDDLFITIQGQGGHAAAPHQTIDPVFASAQIITALQSLVSRLSNPNNPTVLSFGRLEANGSFNIIPDSVNIYGTFRTMDANWRIQGQEKIIAMIHKLADAFSCTAKIEIIPGYPPVENETELCLRTMNYAKQLVTNKQIKQIPSVMWAEDFAYYQGIAPCCFYNIGVSTVPENAYGLHSSRLILDEASLIKGSAMIAWIALCELQFITDRQINNDTAIE